MQPFEIVCAPYTGYSAPTGTAFPAIDTAPAVAWVQIGTSGNKNYTDAGVGVQHPQTIGEFTPAGSTTVRKAWRQAEGLIVTFSVADLTVEAYAALMGGMTITTVTTTTGVAGNKSIEFYRGPLVNAVALLIRGISPYDETKNAQYEIQAAYQAGSPSPTFSKANPAELAAEFRSYELNAGHLGVFRAATLT